ncbi:hypothetical protein ABEB36_002335 [Hypothenemus hampei]|uniref:Peptidase S1 domain-containing protein n=1 Tax=Hypothenemus hampei TaxID=57062 RepID=A0ABD1F5E2_HYPHA
MKAGFLIGLLATIFLTISAELTDSEYQNAIPGHIEYDPEFKKLYPHIPAPASAAEPFIVGGSESRPNTRPYQCAMYIPVPGGTSFCGCSLITARTVLTAAHCVDNTVNNITIWFGIHNLPPNQQAHGVSVSTRDIILHPGWTRSILLHDIALIILPQTLQLTNNISTVMLPLDNSQDYLGNTTLVSGWGRPSDSIGTISPVLREVTSFVISNFPCRLAYMGIVEESHICCSGRYGRSTCNGDSGGPLVINGVQVGVVSFGSNWGCEQGWPPVFARVANYLPWIHQNWLT